MAAEGVLKGIARQIVAGDAPLPELEAFAAPFAGSVGPTRHSEVHIFDIANRESTFTTAASIECKAQLAGGGWRAVVSTLHASWSLPADGGAPELESCTPGDAPQVATSPAPWFSERTGEVIGGEPAFHHHLARGLDHWLARVEAAHGIDAFIRNGMALGDADGDGRDDLYVCQPGGLPNRLLLHLPDGTVAEAPDDAGADILDHTSAALFVDLDNDGDQDLALATPAGIVLLENDGAAKFSPRGTLRTDSSDCHALAAADYDLDGHLDLYVTFALGDRLPGEEAGAFRFHDARDGGHNQLFRGDGGWSFSEATARSGLAEDDGRHSLAAAWGDFDRDGDPDLYVANDYGPNQLYRNDGGTFAEVAAGLGAQDYGAGMSAAWGDFDRDGRTDLYVGNMFSNAGHRVTAQAPFLAGAPDGLLAVYRRFAKGNTLLRQRRDGTFAEIGGATEMGRWAWSSLFADLDNDGWEDLFVANGYITGPQKDDL